MKKYEEIEVVFTDINTEELERKLESIGAKRIKEVLYRDVVFDYPDLRLNNDKSWIRLRDNGEKIKLAYKKRLSLKDNSYKDDIGMKEVEIDVSDFQKTIDLFLSIGMIIKIQTEKKRIRWEKDGVAFDIDTWPELNTYLEIESISMEKIDKAIEEIGFNVEDKRIINMWQIYQENDINPEDYKKIMFSGLEKK